MYFCQDFCVVFPTGVVRLYCTQALFAPFDCSPFLKTAFALAVACCTHSYTPIHELPDSAHIASMVVCSHATVSGRHSESTSRLAKQVTRGAVLLKIASQHGISGRENDSNGTGDFAWPRVALQRMKTIMERQP
jgi:hypothetical protein